MEIQFNIFEALGKLTRTLSINSDGAPWLVALLLIICAALWLVLDIVTTRLFPEMFGGSFLIYVGTGHSQNIAAHCPRRPSHAGPAGGVW